MIPKIENNFNQNEEYRMLFVDLVKLLPTKTMGFTSKENFNIQIETKTTDNLHKCKWIKYNQKWVNLLIIDIDNKNLEETLKIASKLNLDPSFACSTDKGCHIFYVLSKAIKYDWEKTIKFAKDVKVALTHFLGGDKNGSHKLGEIFRNPLQNPFYYGYGEEYTLNDFKDLCVKYNQINYTPQKKFDTYKNKAKRFNQKFNFKSGNRNNYLFYFGMLESRNKNFSLEQIIDLLHKIQKRESHNVLDNIEVSKIAQSIKNYNDNGTNNITKLNLKNEGIMEFDTISNLSEEDYQKEVKRRQKEGAKYTNEKLKNKGKNMDKRIAHAKRLNQIKETKNRAKILDFISHNLLIEDYKKKNGKWNIIRMVEPLGLSRHTIKRHLEAMGEL